MNAKYVHYLMIGLLLLLVVALFGGAYGVNALLEKQSTQLVGYKAKLSALQTQQSSLKQAKADIKTYTDLYDIAKVVVPANKDQAETVRQIVKIAAASGVKLGTISFPSSTLGNTKTNPTAPAAANQAPAAATGKSTALSQLVAVPNIPGVYVLQITIASDSAHPATYPQLIQFLSGLEQNRLTAEVTSVNIVPDSSISGAFTFTLTLNSYIKP